MATQKTIKIAADVGISTHKKFIQFTKEHDLKKKNVVEQGILLYIEQYQGLMK